MHTEETPARSPEKPPTDHHFETPVVHEERADDVDGTERQRPPSGPTRWPAAVRGRASRPARP
jgi:hypothetical protein